MIINTDNFILSIHTKEYYDDGIFFIESIDFSIIAYGKDEEEAKENFIKHLIYFYNYYKKLSKDVITGKAVKLKKLFSGLSVFSFERK